MRSSVLMTLCLITCGALLAPGAGAQTTVEPPSGSTAQDAAGASQEPASPNASATDQAVDSAADAATDGSINQSVADADPNSPGRFIPSEQLSQDLGASFPVDI